MLPSRHVQPPRVVTLFQLAGDISTSGSGDTVYDLTGARLLLPPPPSEQATAREDQAGQTCAENGAGDDNGDTSLSPLDYPGDGTITYGPTSAVPGAIAGAGLPGLIFACGGLFGGAGAARSRGRLNSFTVIRAHAACPQKTHFFLFLDRLQRAGASALNCR